MSRALTVSLGAIIGLIIAVTARSLIKKIAAQIDAPLKILVPIGCISGLVFAELIRYRFDAVELQICFAVLCAGLVIQSMIDAYTHQLVRQITHAVAISGVAILSFYSLQNSSRQPFVGACVCATVGVVSAVVVNKISRGSLGSGDVRLMAVLGWHLGFLSYGAAIWALFASSLLAGAVGLVLIMLGRGSWQRRIAFGPFLALGTVLAIFADEVLPSLLIA